MFHPVSAAVEYWVLIDTKNSHFHAQRHWCCFSDNGSCIKTMIGIIITVDVSLTLVTYMLIHALKCQQSIWQEYKCSSDVSCLSCLHGFFVSVQWILKWFAWRSHSGMPATILSPAPAPNPCCSRTAWWRSFRNTARWTGAGVATRCFSEGVSSTRSFSALTYCQWSIPMMVSWIPLTNTKEKGPQHFQLWWP